MTPRFRYIVPDGREHAANDVAELADAIRSGAVGPDTFLDDSSTGTWNQARNHDVFGALDAASAPAPREPSPVDPEPSASREGEWRTAPLPPPPNIKQPAGQISDNPDPVPQHHGRNRRWEQSAQVLLALVVVLSWVGETPDQWVEGIISAFGVAIGIGLELWRRRSANRQIRTGILFGAGIAGSVVVLLAFGFATGMPGEAIAALLGYNLVKAAMVSWALSYIIVSAVQRRGTSSKGPETSQQRPTRGVQIPRGRGAESDGLSLSGDRLRISVAVGVVALLVGTAGFLALHRRSTNACKWGEGLSQREWEEVLHTCQKVVDRKLIGDEDRMRAQLTLLTALHALERYDQALLRARLIASRNPTAEWGHHWVWSSLLALGRNQEALHVIRRRLQERPSDPVLYSKLGETYLDSQSWTAAHDSYRRAAELGSDAGDWAMLGHIAHWLGRSREAQEAFCRALAENPSVFDTNEAARAAWEQISPTSGCAGVRDIPVQQTAPNNPFVESELESNAVGELKRRLGMPPH